MFSDATFWQELTKWLAGIVSTLALIFGGFIKWWVGDRFKKVDEDIDHVNKKANLALDRGAKHDVSIAEIQTYSKATKESIEKIETKLDRLLERSGT